MPQVPVYGQPRVNDQGITDARVRAPDFGPGIGAGVEALGKGLGEAAQKADEIADVQARVEANRLDVEHTKLTQSINQRVRETLGEGAPAAADLGAQDLEKGTADILAKASPRAKLLLQTELARRNLSSVDGYHEHGFTEQGKALESSSVARINNISEMAAQEQDEDKARALLAPVREINAQRAKFFGYGKDWEDTEDRKVVSGFFKSRTLKLTVGESGSAYAAIEYATKNRQYMTDDDYNAVVSAYNDNALDELATSIYQGTATPSSTTATTTVPTAAGDQPVRRLSAADFFKSFIAPHEGSAYVVDSNGKGVKYGINAASYPNENIQGMTLDRASAIFDKDFFQKSGADKLPPALAAVHADTSFLNPSQAKKILAESGGDVDKYLDLRRAFLNGLVAKNPAKYAKYQKAWTNRTNDLEAFANRQGTDGTPIKIADKVGPDTNLTAWREAVMARTDIGATLKNKLIAIADKDRAQKAQEQNLVEQQAAGELALAAANLGDKFTDVKQLPQSAWLSASKETQARWTQAAKANVENKPLSPQLAADIGFIRSFKPELLADPHTLAQFAAKGVPARVISTLAEEGGRAKGALAAPKAIQQVDRSALETLARPAFEAHGYRFWTTEQGDAKSQKKGLTAAEQKLDAQRKINVLNYLEREAAAWAQNNPGKKADDLTMQKWIGTALLSTTRYRDVPLGAQNDQEIADSVGQQRWNEARRRLNAAGVEVNGPQGLRNVADYLRRREMLLKDGVR